MPALHPDREMERKEWRMRKIDLIVIHCTATREDKSLSPAELDRMHRQGIQRVRVSLLRAA